MAWTAPSTKSLGSTITKTDWNTYDKLRTMAPCSVLDIGSPLAQNVAAACMPGVDVTVLDVRGGA